MVLNIHQAEKRYEEKHGVKVVAQDVAPKIFNNVSSDRAVQLYSKYKNGRLDRIEMCYVPRICNELECTPNELFNFKMI